MNKNNTLCFLTAFLLHPFWGYGQGTFMNLNFESANLSTLSQYQSGLVPVTEALPGWQVYYGGVQQSTMVYNNLSFGSVSVDLMHSNSVYNWQAMDGNFSAVIQAGAGPGGLESASIQQTGIVPAGTQSISVEGYSYGPPSLTLNGTTISLSPIGSAGQYTIYGGDISVWAGQTATLAFTASPTTSNPGYGFWIDNISFSPTPVPEPTTLGLMATGIVMLGGRRFWRRVQRSSRGITELPEGGRG